MQVTAKQERDQAGRVAARYGVPVRFQFLRFAELEKPFPSESRKACEALPCVPVVNVALLVRDDGALLQFGEPVKLIAELDSAP